MRISDWSSDVCSSDLQGASAKRVFAMISFLRLKDSFQPQPASLGRPHRGESDMVELIISLIAGAVGGNAAAKIFNSIDMGVVVNSIAGIAGGGRSEEHTSELQSLMRCSYAVFCLKKTTTR